MAVTGSSLANSFTGLQAQKAVNNAALAWLTFRSSQGIKKIFFSGGGLVFTKKLSFCPISIFPLYYQLLTTFFVGQNAFSFCPMFVPFCPTVNIALFIRVLCFLILSRILSRTFILSQKRRFCRFCPVQTQKGHRLGWPVMARTSLSISRSW